MSAFRLKPEWRRCRFATPLKTRYFLHRGFLYCPHNLGQFTKSEGELFVRIFGKRGQSLHSARHAENGVFAGQQTYALYVNPQIADMFRSFVETPHFYPVGKL